MLAAWTILTRPLSFSNRLPASFQKIACCTDEFRVITPPLVCLGPGFGALASAEKGGEGYDSLGELTGDARAGRESPKGSPLYGVTKSPKFSLRGRILLGFPLYFVTKSPKFSDF